MSASPATSIAEVLSDAFALHGSRPLLRIDADCATYAEVDAEVRCWVRSLVAEGVSKGSRVALSASNGPDFVAIVLATLRLGAVVVMVSTAWRDTETAHALSLTNPSHLLHDGSAATDFERVATAQRVRHIDNLRNEHLSSRDGYPDESAVRGGPDGEGQRAVAHPDDLAVMVFSSGTLGLPKAVMHSHRTLAVATAHWIDTLDLGADDRLQIATPPFHILGLLNLLAVIAAGASVRLHRRFDLHAVLRAIQNDGVTIEMAVAPIALAMASHPELESYDLSSLRYIMWGATPVSASIAETVTRRSGVGFLPAYGASELPVIAVNPVRERGRWRLDSVGLAPPGVTLRVVDLVTGVEIEQTDNPERVGEIQARSASQMIGYLPEDANADAFDDGWYRTGDVGRIEPGGWVVITDRVKEMIKVNGFQIAPAEIESVLLRDSNVVDCAVFGIPDEQTGEAIVAAVVHRSFDGTSEESLRSLVGRSLASYKQLREVWVVHEIPRLPSGKVLRRHLKSTYLETYAR